MRVLVIRHHDIDTAGFIGDGYRTDDNKDKGSKTITFTPKIPKSGRYEVRFAYPPMANRANLGYN